MSGRSLKDGENLTPQELWRFEWDALTGSATEEKGEQTEAEREAVEAHNARLAAMI